MQQANSRQKVALITGAARRVGATIARELHQSGCRVLIHHRGNADAAKALAEELNAIEAKSAHCLFADFDKPGATSELAEQVRQVTDRLDILVNNASSFFATPFANASHADWDNLFNSNAKAPYFLSQELAPLLKQQQGCVVNITDHHAKSPLGTYSLYCMAKSALLMMTMSLAKELAPDIRVNAVAPGAIAWPEGKASLSEEQQQAILAKTALKRHGCPADIAKAVKFLCFSADYITGQTLAVDGGRT